MPLEAYQRRADWQAALIVALVVVPGFLDALQAAAANARAAPPVRAAAPRRHPGAVRAGHVRPPRSC